MLATTSFVVLDVQHCNNLSWIAVLTSVTYVGDCDNFASSILAATHSVNASKCYRFMVIYAHFIMFCLCLLYTQILNCSRIHALVTFRQTLLNYVVE